MLSEALVSTSLNIGLVKVISDLMQSLERSRPPRDVSLVLWILSEPPFEPMFIKSKISLQMIIGKTVILVLLAS